METNHVSNSVADEASLERHIQCRLGSRVKDLRVEVRAEGVVIHGRAATYHAKQLAQHAAMEVAGMPVLVNDIDVY